MEFKTAAKLHQAARKEMLEEAVEDGHATVAEMARETDIPKSSARPLVRELVEEDRLVQVGVTEAGAQSAPIYTVDDREADR